MTSLNKGQENNLYNPIYKNFWYFFCARLLMMAAFQIISVALGWQMYMLTKNPFDLGLVGLAQFLPKLFLVLPAGVAIDKFDRKQIVYITLSVQLFITLILILASLNLYISISKNLILLACIIIGLCRTFDGPALQAILPDIIAKPMLPKAIASSTSAMQIAIIIAPALGGFLYAYGAYITYITILICYFGSIIAVYYLPKVININHNNQVNLSSMLSGLKYIYNNKHVLGAISLDLFVVLLGGATALLPIFAHDILHVDAFGLGILRSAPAAGALLMSFFLAKYPLQDRVGRSMFIAVIIFGISMIIFGLSTSFLLSLCALVISGASDVISVIVRTSFIQLETPNEMRGRVNAVNSLFIGASNQLGEFESGLTASWFGTKLSVILGGCGTLLIAILWMKWFPSLLEKDKF